MAAPSEAHWEMDGTEVMEWTAVVSKAGNRVAAALVRCLEAKLVVRTAGVSESGSRVMAVKVGV